MSNKEAIANVVDESQLPTNETGETAELTQDELNNMDPMERAAMCVARRLESGLQPDGNPLSTEGLNAYASAVDPVRTNMVADKVTERFTETETVEKAATNVHPDIQNPEAIKERVSEVFIGATKKCSEDLYTALVDELGHAVAKLKTIKAPSERGEVIHQISELNQKISTVLDLFLSSN